MEYDCVLHDKDRSRTFPIDLFVVKDVAVSCDDDADLVSVLTLEITAIVEFCDAVSTEKQISIPTFHHSHAKCFAHILTT